MRSAAFDAKAREAALAELEAARARVQDQTPAEFIAQLMRISAFAQNGHDFFEGGTGWFPETRLPLRLAWFADELVVARVPRTHRRWLGARVMGIDGRSPAEVMEALRRHDGALPGYLRSNKHWIIESAAMLNAIGIAKHSDRVRLDLVRRDGEREEIELGEVAKADIPLDQGRIGLYAAQASPREQALSWDNAVADAPSPLYLQEPERLYRLVELPELDALYIQFRGNYDGGGQSVAEFAREAGERLAASPRAHVIVDQRFNHGGNSDLTVELMHQIGRHSRGRVYVLVGGQTFSAGIVSTAAVKHTANGRVTLIGEPVGDPLRWWSEGDNTCLPNSGYCLRYTTGLWDLVNGCSGEPGCYGDRFGIRVTDLDPDIPAPITHAAWLEGRDPALEAVAADLRHPGSGDAAAKGATR